MSPKSKHYLTRLFCIVILVIAGGRTANSQIVTLLNEDFSSNSFATNGWTFPNGQSNWQLGSSSTPAGGTAPNAFFNWASSITNYSAALLSNTINATAINGPVLLDYLLLFNPYNTATLEEFKVEYKTVSSSTWTLLAHYTNSVTSITNWSVTNVTLQGVTGQNFQIKFTAYGLNSFSITRWSLDNIHVKGTNCISSLPSLTVSGTPTLCAGASASLTVAGGGSSYTWTPISGGNGSVAIVSPTVTTTYAVISSIPGCSVTPVSAIKTVSVITNTSSLSAAGSSSVICSGSSVTLTANGVSTYSWNTGATTTSIIVSPSVSTTYSVSNTNSLGCVLTKTVDVIVNPSPVISVYSTNSLICSGNTNNLIANGAVTYTWNNGSNSSIVSVNPQTSTVYSVAGTDAQGCSSSASINVVVSPPVTITANNLSVCAGQSATLTASSSASYTWSNASSGGSISVNPSATTSYSVYATDNIGCTSSASITITVNPNPTVTIANPNLSICLGSAATLSANGASTYTWSNAMNGQSITVTPLTNTVYSVSGTGSNGCTGSNNSATVAVTVIQVPTITVTSPSTSICSGLTLSLSASGATSYTWSFGATGATATTSATGNTTYSVLGSNAQQCSSAGTININVLPSPTLSIASNGTNICIGSTATLLASGAQQYLWNTGSTVNVIYVAPQTNTSYTVTGTGANACVSNKTIEINVTPYPVITVSQNDSLICLGESANLTASGAQTYLWSNTMTGSSIVISPQVTTTYTVSGSTNGCSTTASITQNVDECTGIKNHSLNEALFYFYPNPNNGIATIHFNSPGQVKLLEVYSVSGQILLSEKIHSDTYQIDLTQKANGLYYLKITSGEKQSMVKLIKE